VKSPFSFLFSYLPLSLCVALGLLWVPNVSAGDLVQQGEYIFKLAGCQGCHTDTEHKGARLAGGRALATPFGTFYPPNLTPDSDTGLGKWTEEDFVRALSRGVGPSGQAYFPVFPYTSYTHMSREDMHALWTYLRTVPAVAQPNRSHDLAWYLNRMASWGWQLVFFSPDSGQSPIKNRGEYIATAMAHCQECHTPRNIFGVLKHQMAYAGTLEGPEGATVPNITTDPKTGISGWSRTDLVDFFKEGALPDGDFAGGLMVEVIDNGLKYLNKEDVEALAGYIGTLPPISNAISKKKKSAITK